MKIGFNEGCNRFCENHSVLEDLDLCEKYGVDSLFLKTLTFARSTALTLSTSSPSAWTERSLPASTPSTTSLHGLLIPSTT